MSGHEGAMYKSTKEAMDLLVEKVYSDSTHVILLAKPTVGWIPTINPVLKSVGKQVWFMRLCEGGGCSLLRLRLRLS